MPAGVEPRATELPHDTAKRHEVTYALRDALALLPEEQRVTLVLRYVHDLAHEQIADAMWGCVRVPPGRSSRAVARSSALFHTLDQYTAEGGEPCATWTPSRNSHATPSNESVSSSPQFMDRGVSESRLSAYRGGQNG